MDGITRQPGTRYDAAALRALAHLLERADMPADRAADVADILVEGDLMLPRPARPAAAADNPGRD